MGGKASGKSRQRRKALRILLKEAINSQLSDLPEDMRIGIMQAAKLRDDSLSVADAVYASLIRTACKGNPHMMRLLWDMLDETPDIRLRDRELRLREKLASDGGTSVGTVEIIDDLEDIHAIVGWLSLRI